MFSAFFRGRRRCCCPHKKVTLMARCTSSISLCLLTLLTTFAFAQKGAPQDDNTNSPAMQQIMQERAQERAQKGKGANGKNLEVEQDDPTARLEWQRRAFGVHTPQSKHRLLQQRAARSAARAAGNKAAINNNLDLSTAGFSAELPQTGSSALDPAWISVGPADADY